MSEVSQTSLSRGQGVRDRRFQLLRTIMFSSGIMSAVSAVLFLVIWLVDRRFPGNYLALVSAGAVVTIVACFWLESRGLRDLALGLFSGAMVIVVLGMMFFTGGASGPVAVVLILMPVIVGLIGGGRSARWMAVAIGILYFGMVLLEVAEVIVPRVLVESATWWVYASVCVIGLAVVVFLVSGFSDQIDESWSMVQVREQQLMEAERQSRQSAQSEREARLEQERTTGRLRAAIRRYLAFLERVSEGDREVRLALDDEQEDVQELRILGEYLNRTVDALTGALEEMESVQRRYTAEAWSTFAARGGTGFEFAYADGQVTAAGPDVGGMPLMQRATEQGDAVVEGTEVAIPLVAGGEVIGVLGAERETGWDRDDLDVIRAAMSQLAQTIENLRLLDQTQRGALRERAIGQVAGRVRQELNVEGVLRAAVDEIQQVLGVERVTLRMVGEAQEQG